MGWLLDRECLAYKKVRASRIRLYKSRQIK